MSILPSLSTLPKTRRALPFAAAIAVAAAAAVPARAGLPPLDIEQIEIFRFVDRIDGVIPMGDPTPYEFETCVIGENIVSASFTDPDMDGFTLVQEQFEPTAWCYREEFADAAAVELAFPDGDYVYTVNGASATDMETVSYAADEPGAFPDITSPMNGATVPEDVDLQVQFTLVEKPNGIGCLTPMPSGCASSITYSVFDVVGGQEVDFDLLTINDTSFTLDDTLLSNGQQLEIEVETFRGTFDFFESTDTLGDAFELIALYEDINIITVDVPAPGAGPAGAASLLALAALRRRRTSRP